jgi:phosphatidate cytidylyltransferase
MKARILTALIALPVLVLSVILPYLTREADYSGALFVAIAAFAIGAGLFEFFSLSKRLELKGDASIAYLGAAGLFAAFVLDAPKEAPDLLLMILTLFVVILLITQAFRFQADFSKILVGTGVTLLGVLYVSFLGGFLVSTMTGFNGSDIPYLSSKLLGFFFITVMAADSGAYFVGKALGKHKIVPKISPGKSWEGLAGGVALGLVGGAVANYSFFPELKILPAILLAITFTLVGFLGDIAESAIKRGAGAKDAASILPGHGGFLDRLDSLLFTAPILYFFARIYFQ